MPLYAWRWFAKKNLASSGEDYSYCKRYRYDLWRIWDESLKYLVVIGLSPSQADRGNSDPYLSKCAMLARNNGYGGIHLLNIFAFSISDTRTLLLHPSPIGKLNDEAIKKVSMEAGMVVAGWGNEGAHMCRDEEIFELMSHCKVKMRCLGLTSRNHPRHVLFSGLTSAPIEFR